MRFTIYHQLACTRAEGAARWILEAGPASRCLGTDSTVILSLDAKG